MRTQIKVTELIMNCTITHEFQITTTYNIDKLHYISGQNKLGMY